MSMQKPNIHKPLLLSSLVMSITLAGCASTTTAPDPNDPWAGWNRGAQTFNDNLDKAILNR
jgi:phospholipid-binding lipoprotein MlaA